MFKLPGWMRKGKYNPLNRRKGPPEDLYKILRREDKGGRRRSEIYGDRRKYQQKPTEGQYLRDHRFQAGFRSGQVTRKLFPEERSGVKDRRTDEKDRRKKP